MWNVKAKVIPVIIVTTGPFSKSLRQYLSNIPGKDEIKELKKSHIGHYTHTHTHYGKCYCTSTKHISQAK